MLIYFILFNNYKKKKKIAILFGQIAQPYKQPQQTWSFFFKITFKSQL